LEKGSGGLCVGLFGDDWGCFVVFGLWFCVFCLGWLGVLWLVGFVGFEGVCGLGVVWLVVCLIWLFFVVGVFFGVCVFCWAVCFGLFFFMAKLDMLLG
jgi:hypothetical protein